MDVNDLVQERIAAARRKIANDKRRRAELKAARDRGLTARHAQKLRRFAGQLDNHTPAASAA
ncbi:hypothetical protein AB0407_22560 [Streptomyces microflavus]|uniref:hypothetical protein n=1 Tax=Streptomyces microflavus TaxID=1919 RepID=UPI00344C85D6